MTKVMEILTNNALTAHPVTLFSLGTVFGATSVYFFLRMRRKPSALPNVAVTPPQKNPVERIHKREEYRLIIGVRNDLKMQKGKVAAQCGHAAVAAYAKALKNVPKTLSYWLKYGQPKITVKINSEKELLDLQELAQENDVLSSIVRDAGQTQVEPGARTVIAIGPAPKSILDKITGHLKLY